MEWDISEMVEYCLDSIDNNDIMVEPFPNTINFYNDNYPECLDISDIIINREYNHLSIGHISVFNTEERSCIPGYKQFKCGDGRCVTDFDECLNKRHLLLYQSISLQGNLTSSCWSIMVCLTKISNEMNGTSCEEILETSNIHKYLQTCDDIIQFPTVPVLFGHVRFLYVRNNTYNENRTLALVPDYICYDNELCDFLRPTFHHGIYSCIIFNFNMIFQTWSTIISVVEPYFRQCLTRLENKNASQSQHTSLYCCKNSSKCISKHRILDNISDCYLNDDEHEYESSCLLNNAQRFKCDNDNKCYSSIVSKDICPLKSLYNFDEISFNHICDRDVQMFPILINGENHTDETECEHWSCNNYYTQCDGFWSCPYGEDEENCTTKRQICPLRSLACVSPFNYTLTCLSAHRVNDGIIDCLGSADERHYCRNLVRNSLGYYGFRCWNESECIAPGDLCDKSQKCLFNDDEMFCDDYQEDCTECDHTECTDVIEALCRASYLYIFKFSLETSPVYPPISEQRTNEYISQQPQNLPRIDKLITTEPYDQYRCFCPSPYYGDHCQYQNQRISLTLQVIIIGRKGFYAILATLIGNDGDYEVINSYHELTLFNTRECDRIHNIYLTYLSRPKNNSMNYSIHIDVYDKVNLIYLGTWYYPVLFPFLPSNRMAIILVVSNNQVFGHKQCSLICNNGECMKYMNDDKMFCRCHTCWSGSRCDIPIRCSDCASDSICIGMIYNRSICLCRLDKGGLRCLLPLSCPEGSCDNNASCIMTDIRMHERSFTCNCSKELWGTVCNFQRPKFQLAIKNIKYSSPIILMYIFTVGIFDPRYLELEQIVVPVQLKMFQKPIEIYVETDFKLIFAKIDQSFYLTIAQETFKNNISTSIDPAQRCPLINEVLNTSLANLHQIRRIKYYYTICQNDVNLRCFFDDPYMCLCTNDRHANCLKLKQIPSVCRHKTYCENNGQCLDDGSLCPVETVCNCTNCYFGDRCQFQAQGVGLTLDDILRYEIEPTISLFSQTNLVKWCTSLTIIMLIAGLINSALAMLTFRMQKSREVGCGVYLLASSVTSLLTVTMLALKFSFLLFTHINSDIDNSAAHAGCRSLEFILKTCLYTDNWLNACVALERLMTVYKGVYFNKLLSRRIARRVILLLPFAIMVSIIHEPIYRKLYKDEFEQRLWCLFLYSQSLHRYNVFISLVHLLGPFCANLCSSVYIVIGSARQRALLQPRISYRQHRRQQLMEHKHLIISSMILVILSMPRIVTAFISGCIKTTHNSQLYAAGYFISFIPSVSIFAVFVMPSDFYKEQFKKSLKIGLILNPCR
ncbi:hypothetical protein I4U23_016410 [Adineta vaga]|nr:hypothetical protein I4U23_016410 [Adineta vaga]